MWFESCLSGRTQLLMYMVFANVTCGVPQASILGPLSHGLRIRSFKSSKVSADQYNLGRQTISSSGPVMERKTLCRR